MALGTSQMSPHWPHDLISVQKHRLAQYLIQGFPDNWVIRSHEHRGRWQAIVPLYPSYLWIKILLSDWFRTRLQYVTEMRRRTMPACSRHLLIILSMQAEGERKKKRSVIRALILLCLLSAVVCFFWSSEFGIVGESGDFYEPSSSLLHSTKIKTDPWRTAW